MVVLFFIIIAFIMPIGWVAWLFNSVALITLFIYEPENMTDKWQRVYRLIKKSWFVITSIGIFCIIIMILIAIFFNDQIVEVW